MRVVSCFLGWVALAAFSGTPGWSASESPPAASHGGGEEHAAAAGEGKNGHDEQNSGHDTKDAHEKADAHNKHGTQTKHDDRDNHAAHDDHSETAMVEYAARTSSRDVKVPRALVGRIEREYKDYLAKLGVSSPKEGIKRALININAELTQKHKSALHDNTRINTPTGGGVIDLSEVVTPVRGAFRVKLNATKENGQALSAKRVYFVSRAKPRILAGEEYGAGCDKFMEITTQFQKKWEHAGFEVYTADQRYISVLGGTFIFTEFDKEALYVGSVTFTDSRHPDLLCE